MHESIVQDRIYLKGQLTIPFIKKRNFTGSWRGMRYNLYKQDDKLIAATYPQPYCWECTPEEQKTYKEFALTEEGLDAAVDWLNESYRNGNWDQRRNYF